MDLSKIISINGKSGLFQMVGQRSNGVLVKSLATNKKQFISARTHIFSMIDNISIYTNDDGSVPLHDVFQEMLRNEEKNAVPEAKEDKEVLANYLATVLPNYDKERVYFSDMKKLVRWYAELKANDLVDLEPKLPEIPEDTDKEEEVK